MFTADQLVASMRAEIDIIRHLATKVPEGTMDWRLSRNQRSTQELLRYLTVCAEMPARYLRDDNWDAVEEINTDWDAVEGVDVREDALDLAEFDAAMRRQADNVEEIVRSFSDQELLERDTAMPWGTPCKTGQGFVNMCLKCLVAYRMQLFLHLKASGASDLGSTNLWIGMDLPDSAEG